MSRSQRNIDELENVSVKRLLWKYFLPSFAGVILNSLYNIVDRIFIGQGVGAIALSGISAVFPVMLIVMGFGMLIGIGSSVRISINLGKKDINRAEKVLGNSVVLIFIISVFITILGFIIKVPLLNMFGVSDETFGYANSYLNIILSGTAFGMMGFALNNVIRSEGNAKIAMYSMFISAGLNMLLDPLFIFVFDMGVKGAAWATIISQLALAIWVLNHFLSKKSVISLHFKNFKLDRKIIWYILTIGFAPFSMQIAASFVQGTFNTQLIKFGGDIAVGAMGIIISITMLILMSIIAINMASQPIIGFSHGSKNYKRVKEALVVSLWAATIISTCGFLVVELFPQTIVKLFNHESSELLEIGTTGLRIFLCAWPIVGFQIVASSYYQATGKAGTAVFLSLLRQVIVLIPILILIPNFWGLTGVWLAGPISDAVSGIVCGIFILFEFRKINSYIKYPELIKSS
ncbi:MAG: MATE family efflux transporter [Bacteroidales bacterium]|nr:MATE family efflux transporter [Bacteroidales bacterium]MBN2818664.1 MATE family efflux transporter [Bacteroidales bacterium]